VRFERSLFDDPLFVRTPDGMLPTATAERLAVPVSNAIASIREALRQSEEFDPETSTREFRLAMSDIGQHVFLPRICEKLERVAPEVRLSAEPESGRAAAKRTGSQPLPRRIEQEP
jgi:DNA-binding transcriptional LysR family regulator